MRVLDYQVGQSYPLERQVGLCGAAFDEPLWFVLKCNRSREESAAAFLSNRGVFAWFPEEEVWRRQRSNNRERKRVRRKVAPGYVFALFPGQPYWDRLFDAWPGRWHFRTVVTMGGRPCSITDETVAEMELLPDRLREKRERDAEAARIHPGDRVRVIAGPLEGWTTEVGDLDGAMARILTPLLGKDAVVDVARLRKIEDPK